MSDINNEINKLIDIAKYLVANGLATKDESKLYEQYRDIDFSEYTDTQKEDALSALQGFENVSIKDRQIEALLLIAPDFIVTDNEKDVFERYKNIDITLLSDEEKQEILQTLEICKSRQLKYIQQQFYSNLLEIVDTYIKIQKMFDLFNTNLATISYEMKYLISNSIHSPNRFKAMNSFLNNYKKEYLTSIKKLPKNPTKKDIDKTFQEMLLPITKDLYAATIIFHMANDISEYCSKSEDPQVRLLFRQYITIRNYLQSITSKNKKVKISDAFIDGENNPDAPNEVKPLDIANIKTKEDYYNQKIGLLTLLANASMFEFPSKQNKDDKKNRIISEIDLSSIDLIHLAKLSNPPPTNFEEYIDRVIEIADKKIFGKYLPFDEQLKNALTEQENESNKDTYKKPLTPAEIEKYLIELEHLKDNLNRLNGDRLYNYILQKESKNIVTKPNDIQGFDIQIVSDKVVAKPNGFFAIYNTLKINQLGFFELQFRDEFREYMAREGYSAHNATLEGKGFDIMPFFELTNPSPNTDSNQKKLNKYCKFLNIIRHNDVKSAQAKTTNRNEYEDLLINLCNYVESRITVKDSFHTKTTSLTFFQYMESIIAFYCAKHGIVQANHTPGDHNTVAVKQSTIRETLFSFLKNRVGLSSLAFMIIDKYDEQSFLLSRENVTKSKPSASSASYFTLSDEREAERYIKAYSDDAIKILLSKWPSEILQPMGHNPNTNNGSDSQNNPNMDYETR
ncbi:MAG TPA: hypothetical protein DEP51_00965 [Clostridiales bacterium]|nr:hypothetical protein [Clostridiales bacterium]